MSRKKAKSEFSKWFQSWQKRAKAVERIRKNLGSTCDGESPPVPWSLLLHVVARHRGIEPVAIMGRGQTARVVRARDALFGLLVYRGASLSDVARAFERDPSSIGTALGRLDEKSSTLNRRLTPEIETARRAETLRVELLDAYRASEKA